MAVISAVIVPANDIEILRAYWANLTTDDTGAPIEMAAFADRSIQMTGTFDGATVAMQGSNDGGTTWVTLKDPFGNDLTFTAAGLRTIVDLAYHVRPAVTVNGAGGCDVNAYLIMRQA